MRAFIAIELPGDVKAALEALSGRLRGCGAKASWVRPGNMHLTLRFLGDIDSDTVHALAARLQPAYAALPAFTMHVAGVGAFPNTRKPAVAWAGAGPIEGGLAEAQRAAEAAAVAVGLTPDAKAFRPHLTVARIRDKRRIGSLPQALEREEDFHGGAFDVTHVSLFSSELRPQGPWYRRLEEFPLCPNR